MIEKEALGSEPKIETVTTKEHFKSNFKSWIRIVALIVVAVFLPEQVAQAVQYDPAVLWQKPVVFTPSYLKDIKQVDLPLAIRNILGDIANKPISEIKISPTLSVKLEKPVNISPKKIEELYHWLQGRPCGSKALYDFLAYKGLDVAEQDIAVMALSIDILNGVVKPEGDPKVIKNSLLALSKASEFFGAKLYPVKIDAAALADEAVLAEITPFLAHLKGDHYILVTKVGQDKVYFSDQHKEEFLPKARFLEEFSGYALVSQLISALTLLSPEEASRVKGAGDWGGTGSSRYDDWRKRTISQNNYQAYNPKTSYATQSITFGTNNANINLTKPIVSDLATINLNVYDYSSSTPRVATYQNILGTQTLWKSDVNRDIAWHNNWLSESTIKAYYQNNKLVEARYQGKAQTEIRTQGNIDKWLENLPVTGETGGSLNTGDYKGYVYNAGDYPYQAKVENTGNTVTWSAPFTGAVDIKVGMSPWEIAFRQQLTEKNYNVNGVQYRPVWNYAPYGNTIRNPQRAEEQFPSLNKDGSSPGPSFFRATDFGPAQANFFQVSPLKNNTIVPIQGAGVGQFSVYFDNTGLRAREGDYIEWGHKRETYIIPQSRTEKAFGFTPTDTREIMRAFTLGQAADNRSLTIQPFGLTAINMGRGDVHYIAAGSQSIDKLGTADKRFTLPLSNNNWNIAFDEFNQPKIKDLISAAPSYLKAGPADNLAYDASGKLAIDSHGYDIMGKLVGKGSLKVAELRADERGYLNEIKGIKGNLVDFYVPAPSPDQQITDTGIKNFSNNTSFKVPARVETSALAPGFNNYSAEKDDYFINFSVNEKGFQSRIFDPGAEHYIKGKVDLWERQLTPTIKDGRIQITEGGAFIQRGVTATAPQAVFSRYGLAVDYGGKVGIINIAAQSPAKSETFKGDLAGKLTYVGRANDFSRTFGALEERGSKVQFIGVDKLVSDYQNKIVPSTIATKQRLVVPLESSLTVVKENPDFITRHYEDYAAPLQKGYGHVASAITVDQKQFKAVGTAMQSTSLGFTRDFAKDAATGAKTSYSFGTGKIGSFEGLDSREWVYSDYSQKDKRRFSAAVVTNLFATIKPEFKDTIRLPEIRQDEPMRAADFEQGTIKPLLEGLGAAKVFEAKDFDRFLPGAEIDKNTTYQSSVSVNNLLEAQGAVTYNDGLKSWGIIAAGSAAEPLIYTAVNVKAKDLVFSAKQDNSWQQGRFANVSVSSPVSILEIPGSRGFDITGKQWLSGFNDSDAVYKATFISNPQSLFSYERGKSYIGLNDNGLYLYGSAIGEVAFEGKKIALDPVEAQEKVKQLGPPGDGLLADGRGNIGNFEVIAKDTYNNFQDKFNNFSIFKAAQDKNQAIPVIFDPAKELLGPAITRGTTYSFTKDGAPEPMTGLWVKPLDENKPGQISYKDSITFDGWQNLGIKLLLKQDLKSEAFDGGIVNRMLTTAIEFGDKHLLTWVPGKDADSGWWKVTGADSLEQANKLVGSEIRFLQKPGTALNTVLSAEFKAIAGADGSTIIDPSVNSPVLKADITSLKFLADQQNKDTYIIDLAGRGKIYNTRVFANVDGKIKEGILRAGEKSMVITDFENGAIFNDAGQDSAQAIQPFSAPYASDLRMQARNSPAGNILLDGNFEFTLSGKSLDPNLNLGMGAHIDFVEDIKKVAAISPGTETRPLIQGNETAGRVDTYLGLQLDTIKKGTQLEFGQKDRNQLGGMRIGAGNDFITPSVKGQGSLYQYYYNLEGVLGGMSASKLSFKDLVAIHTAGIEDNPIVIYTKNKKEVYSDTVSLIKDKEGKKAAAVSSTDELIEIGQDAYTFRYEALPVLKDVHVELNEGPVGQPKFKDIASQNAVLYDPIKGDNMLAFALTRADWYRDQRASDKEDSFLFLFKDPASWTEAHKAILFNNVLGNPIIGGQLAKFVPLAGEIFKNGLKVDNRIISAASLIGQEKDSSLITANQYGLAKIGADTNFWVTSNDFSFSARVVNDKGETVFYKEKNLRGPERPVHGPPPINGENLPQPYKIGEFNEYKAAMATLLIQNLSKDNRASSLVERLKEAKSLLESNDNKDKELGAMRLANAVEDYNTYINAGANIKALDELKEKINGQKGTEAISNLIEQAKASLKAGKDTKWIIDQLDTELIKYRIQELQGALAETFRNDEHNAYKLETHRQYIDKLQGIWNRVKGTWNTKDYLERSRQKKEIWKDLTALDNNIQRRVLTSRWAELKSSMEMRNEDGPAEREDKLNAAYLAYFKDGKDLVLKDISGNNLEDAEKKIKDFRTHYYFFTNFEYIDSADRYLDSVYRSGQMSEEQYKYQKANIDGMSDNLSKAYYAADDNTRGQYLDKFAGAGSRFLQGVKQFEELVNYRQEKGSIPVSTPILGVYKVALYWYHLGKAVLGSEDDWITYKSFISHDINNITEATDRLINTVAAQWHYSRAGYSWLFGQLTGLVSDDAKNSFMAGYGDDMLQGDLYSIRGVHGMFYTKKDVQSILIHNLAAGNLKSISFSTAGEGPAKILMDPVVRAYSFTDRYGNKSNIAQNGVNEVVRGQKDLGYQQLANGEIGSGLTNLIKGYSVDALIIWATQGKGTVGTFARNLGLDIGLNTLSYYTSGTTFSVQDEILLFGGGRLLGSGLNRLFPTFSKLPWYTKSMIGIGTNEVIANSINLAINGEPISDWRTHLVLVGTGALAGVSGKISQSGKYAKPLGEASWEARTTALKGINPKASVTGLYARAFGQNILRTSLSQAGLFGEVNLLTGMVSDALRYKAAPTFESIGWRYNKDGNLVLGHATAGLRNGAIFGGIFGIGSTVASAASKINVPALKNSFMSNPLFKSTALGIIGFPLVKTIIEGESATDGFFTRLWNNYFGRGAAYNYIRGGIIGLGLGWGFNSQSAGFQALLGRGVLTKSAGLGKFFYGGAVGILAGSGVNITEDLIAGRKLEWNKIGWDTLGYFALGGLSGVYIGNQGLNLANGLKEYSLGGTPQRTDAFFNIIKLSPAAGSKLLYSRALAGAIDWTVVSPAFTLGGGFWEALKLKSTGDSWFSYYKPGENILDSATQKAVDNMNVLLPWTWTFVKKDGDWKEEGGLDHKATFSRISGKDLLLSAIEGPPSGLWMKPMISLFQAQTTKGPTVINQGGLVEKILNVGARVFRGKEGFAKFNLWVDNLSSASGLAGGLRWADSNILWMPGVVTGIDAAIGFIDNKMTGANATLRELKDENNDLQRTAIDGKSYVLASRQGHISEGVKSYAKWLPFFMVPGYSGAKVGQKVEIGEGKALEYTEVRDGKPTMGKVDGQKYSITNGEDGSMKFTPHYEIGNRIALKDGKEVEITQVANGKPTMGIFEGQKVSITHNEDGSIKFAPYYEAGNRIALKGGREIEITEAAEGKPTMGTVDGQKYIIENGADGSMKFTPYKEPVSDTQSVTKEQFEALRTPSAYDISQQEGGSVIIGKLNNGQFLPGAVRLTGLDAAEWKRIQDLPSKERGIAQIRFINERPYIVEAIGGFAGGNWDLLNEAGIVPSLSNIPGSLRGRITAESGTKATSTQTSANKELGRYSSNYLEETHKVFNDILGRPANFEEIKKIVVRAHKEHRQTYEVAEDYAKEIKTQEVVISRLPGADAAIHENNFRPQDFKDGYNINTLKAAFEKDTSAEGRYRILKEQTNLNDEGLNQRFNMGLPVPPPKDGSDKLPAGVDKPVNEGLPTKDQVKYAKISANESGTFFNGKDRPKAEPDVYGEAAYGNTPIDAKTAVDMNFRDSVFKTIVEERMQRYGGEFRTGQARFFATEEGAILALVEHPGSVVDIIGQTGISKSTEGIPIAAEYFKRTEGKGSLLVTETQLISEQRGLFRELEKRGIENPQVVSIDVMNRDYAAKVLESIQSSDYVVMDRHTFNALEGLRNEGGVYTEIWEAMKNRSGKPRQLIEDEGHVSEYGPDTMIRSGSEKEVSKIPGYREIGYKDGMKILLQVGGGDGNLDSKSSYEHMLDYFNGKTSDGKARLERDAESGHTPIIAKEAELEIINLILAEHGEKATQTIEEGWKKIEDVLNAPETPLDPNNPEVNRKIGVCTKAEVLKASIYASLEVIANIILAHKTGSAGVGDKWMRPVSQVAGTIYDVVETSPTRAVMKELITSRVLFDRTPDLDKVWSEAAANRGRYLSGLRDFLENGSSNLRFSASMTTEGMRRVSVNRVFSSMDAADFNSVGGVGTEFGSVPTDKMIVTSADTRESRKETLKQNWGGENTPADKVLHFFIADTQAYNKEMVEDIRGIDADRVIVVMDSNNKDFAIRPGQTIEEATETYATGKDANGGKIDPIDPQNMQFNNKDFWHNGKAPIIITFGQRAVGANMSFRGVKSGRAAESITIATPNSLFETIKNDIGRVRGESILEETPEGNKVRLLSPSENPTMPERTLLVLGAEKTVVKEGKTLGELLGAEMAAGEKAVPAIEAYKELTKETQVSLSRGNNTRLAVEAIHSETLDIINRIIAQERSLG
ncbi:MAG: hypothetical protein PHF11_00890, partial [Candidatus Omnitrophica bacterium]|nr:hypothetical protein [Candidatus Omnitrophota bacterium]